MAILNVTSTKIMHSTMYYNIDSKGHNGHSERNVMVTANYLHPESEMSYERQMQRIWKKASDKNTTQLRRVIQSFSREELDPDDVDDQIRANEIGLIAAREMFPDFPAVVCTQRDGKSGLLHNHILVLNVNRKTNNGMRGDMYNVWRLRELNDKVCSRELGDKWIDPKTTEVTKKRESYSAENLKRRNEEKIARGEKPKYVWTDDMKDRILAAREAADSMDDFKSKLKASGVSVVREGVRKSKSAGSSRYCTYQLDDTSGFDVGDTIPKKRRIRSTTLGPEFMPDVLEEAFEMKRKKKARNQDEVTGHEEENRDTKVVQEPEQEVVPPQPIQAEEIKEYEVVDSIDDGMSHAREIFRNMYDDNRQANGVFNDMLKWMQMERKNGNERFDWMRKCKDGKAQFYEDRFKDHVAVFLKYRLEKRHRDIAEFATETKRKYGNPKLPENDEYEM